mgnify:CR=1 FL=1|jgi:hypothetical protein
MPAAPIHSVLSRRAGLAVLGMLGLLAACSKPQVQTTEAYAGVAMRRPDHILVAPFAVTPDEVRLDSGVVSRIQRSSSDVPLSAQQMRVAKAVQSDLADAMVDTLCSYGLPAERMAGPDHPLQGSTLLVEGQIISIDQGNRLRRTVIGLGSGKSSMSADMQIYEATGAERPRFVTAFKGSDDSGRTPGLAEGMGVGAAGGHLLAASAVGTGMHVKEERKKAPSDSEAANLGKALAAQIGSFAASEGWIAPTAIQ